ncbi:MAG: DUF1800 domain-containing protein [Caulobacterales bacterium]
MKRLILALSALFLVACGGGGGGSGGSGGGGATPTPAPPPVTITATEAARLLNQATFGATDATIEQARTAGVSAWLDNEFSAAPAAQTHLAYLDARLVQLRTTNPSASLSATNFYETWWRTAATSPDQLRQRVAFAYSQIFVISLNDGAVDVRGAGSYYDMLTANAFVNFRQLLENVTLHPMMGRYLTYLANQREDAAGTRTPDENYAREVMQLMTIGLWELNIDGTLRTNASNQPIATYTPDDISGLARVFTGLSWYHPAPSNSTFFGGSRDPDASVRPMIFYPQYHSLSAKQFLGTTIPASTTADVGGDLRIALDTLFNHPNVGPFIARQLIQRLVTSNPSNAYVGRVAAVFNNNGSGVRGDMRAVIRAILTDSEARSATAASDPAFGKLREPVIRLTHWMRAYGATSVSGNWLIGSTSSNQSLGQSPLAAPSVFNFWRPGFVPPATTQVGQRGFNAPEFQIVDEVSTAGYINTINGAITNGIGTGNDVRAAYTAELAIADGADALVERLNRVLLAGQISTTLRARVLEAVNSIAIPATGAQAQIDAARLNRVRTAILLIVASPDYLVQR